MAVRFQVDGDFYDHPKSIGMSDAATALWVRAGSYSAAKLLDGFIAEHVLSTLSRSPEEASAELVARGLWRRVRGGFQFHQYGERNLTRERIEADREADRERKRASRLAGQVSHVCHGCGHTYVTARSDSKYCSARCRKKANRDAKAQVETENVPPESIPDSDRNPDGIQAVSVSVSVSESVSGSGREPATPNGAGPSPPEPPTRCPRHLEDPDPPPCGGCADARRAHEAWELAEVERKRNAPKCRTHRGQPAHNCAGCRSDQMVGDR